MDLNEWLSVTGLDPSVVHREAVVVKRGETFTVTTQPGVQGALQPKVKKVATPEEYRALVAPTPAQAPMMPEGVQGCHVDGVSDEAADRLRQARTEAVEFVYAKGEMSEEARAEIVKRYFPLQVAAAALQDVTINTGAQFVIDGGVGTYHFGTVSIHQGGNFVVFSNATIIIDNLVKLPPN
jgi:hypothetical protein